jgi:hypothetical protein
MKVETSSEMLAPGTFRLTYGNPLVKGNQSLPVKAENIFAAVVRVLGGCDEINGNAYSVGKLFGTVERIA